MADNNGLVQDEQFKAAVQAELARYREIHKDDNQHIKTREQQQKYLEEQINNERNWIMKNSPNPAKALDDLKDFNDYLLNINTTLVLVTDKDGLEAGGRPLPKGTKFDIVNGHARVGAGVDTDKLREMNREQLDKFLEVNQSKLLINRSPKADAVFTPYEWDDQKGWHSNDPFVIEMEKELKRYRAIAAQQTGFKDTFESSDRLELDRMQWYQHDLIMINPDRSKALADLRKENDVAENLHKPAPIPAQPAQNSPANATAGETKVDETSDNSKKPPAVTSQPASDQPVLVNPVPVNPITIPVPVIRQADANPNPLPAGTNSSTSPVSPKPKNGFEEIIENILEWISGLFNSGSKTPPSASQTNKTAAQPSGWMEPEAPNLRGTGATRTR